MLRTINISPLRGERITSPIDAFSIARRILPSAYCLLRFQNPPVNKRAKLSTCVKPIIVCNFFRVLPGTTT